MISSNSTATNGHLLDASHLTPASTYAISALAAVASYNSLMLIVLCLATFKVYRGCYFWSLFLASSSIIPHCIGFILFIYVTGVTPYFSATLIVTSWYFMVTGHSLVLWSRLHFVLESYAVLRALLCMIIVDAILLHTPTTVLLYGSLGPDGQTFLNGYSIMERIQLIGFCIQESIISIIYIWKTTRLLKLRPYRPCRKLLTQLLVINIVILALDIALAGLQWVGLYAVQVMFKPVAYSIKLQLEYAILGKLVYIATEAASQSSMNQSVTVEFQVTALERNRHSGGMDMGLSDTTITSMGSWASGSASGLSRLPG